MTYQREIPRDLFNEASLLKCLGRIYINLETAELPDVKLEHDGGAFDIQQDFGSGRLYVTNMQLKLGDTAFRLERATNSREPWPLYLVDEDDNDIDVFNADGSFSEELKAFLRAASLTAQTRGGKTPAKQRWPRA